MEKTTTIYICDRCGKQVVKRQENSKFVESQNEGPVWRRLVVHIQVRSGVHNDAKEQSADLCPACAIHMLRVAMQGVENGVDGNGYPYTPTNRPKE